MKEIHWSWNPGYPNILSKIYFGRTYLSLLNNSQRKTKGNIFTSSPERCYVEECKNFLSCKVKSPLGIYTFGYKKRWEEYVLKWFIKWRFQKFLSQTTIIMIMIIINDKNTCTKCYDLNTSSFSFPEQLCKIYKKLLYFS